MMLLALVAQSLAADKLWLKLSKTDRNKVRLAWGGVESGSHSFIVYKKLPDGNEGWKTISTFNFETDSNVKVLNIYPVNTVSDKNHWAHVPDAKFTFGSSTTEVTLPKSASAKVWMEGGTINGERIEAAGTDPATGRQVIKVDLVSTRDFNANPSMIWSYDVAFIGTWDGNAIEDHDTAANPNFVGPGLSNVSAYIEAGYGVIAGHDTIGRGNSAALLGLGSLREQFGIVLGYCGANCGDVTDWSLWWYYLSSKIRRIKTGLLTEWPHKIDEGALTIPVSHTNNNAPRGDIWFALVEGNWEGNDYNASKLHMQEYATEYFLTTNNNTAMIQTGHSNCNSSQSERNIIANTLYYLKQRTEGNWSTDNSIFDLIAPNRPVCEGVRDGTNLIISCTGSDVAEPYLYRVVGRNKATNNEIQSDAVSIDAGSGVSHFVSWRDDTETPSVPAVPTGFRNFTDKMVIDKGAGARYVHIACVDRAGNMGPSVTLDKNSEAYPTLSIPPTNEASVNGAGQNDADDDKKGSSVPWGYVAAVALLFVTLCALVANGLVERHREPARQEDDSDGLSLTDSMTPEDPQPE